MITQDEQLNKQIDERAKRIVIQFFQKEGFTVRKLTDTPTDNLSIVNRKYVTLNGTVANRPKSSVASVGQFYLSTDTNQPMWYTAGGWRDGNASIVALNN